MDNCQKRGDSARNPKYTAQTGADRSSNKKNGPSRSGWFDGVCHSLKRWLLNEDEKPKERRRVERDAKEIDGGNDKSHDQIGANQRQASAKSDNVETNYDSDAEFERRLNGITKNMKSNIGRIGNSVEHVVSDVHKHAVMEGAKHVINRLQPYLPRSIQCFIYGDESALAKDLQSAYKNLNNGFHFRLAQSVAEIIPDSSNYDLTVVHVLTSVQEAKDQEIMKACQRLQRGIPCLVMIQRESSNLGNEFPPVENTLVVRTDHPKYTKMYIKNLSKQGTDFDLENLIVITNNQLTSCGKDINLTGVWRSKVILNESAQKIL